MSFSLDTTRLFMGQNFVLFGEHTGSPLQKINPDFSIQKLKEFLPQATLIAGGVIGGCTLAYMTGLMMPALAATGLARMPAMIAINALGGMIGSEATLWGLSHYLEGYETAIQQFIRKEEGMDEVAELLGHYGKWWLSSSLTSGAIGMLGMGVGMTAKALVVSGGTKSLVGKGLQYVGGKLDWSDGFARSARQLLGQIPREYCEELADTAASRTWEPLEYVLGGVRGAKGGRHYEERSMGYKAPEAEMVSDTRWGVPTTPILALTREPIPLNEFLKQILRLTPLQRYSKTFASLIKGPSEKDIEAGIAVNTKALKVSVEEDDVIKYQPDNDVIHIGYWHKACRDPFLLAIHLAHELAHAEDILINKPPTAKGYAAMATTAEVYAIEKQMRVAAEFNQAGWMGNFKIKLGSRRLDSQTFLEEMDDAHWQETVDHLRAHIETEVLVKEGEKRISYWDYYIRQHQIELGSRDFEKAYDTDPIVIQRRALERTLADLPYSPLTLEEKGEIKKLINEEIPKENPDGARIADALCRIYAKKRGIQMIPFDEFAKTQRGPFVQEIRGEMERNGRASDDSLSCSVYDVSNGAYGVENDVTYSGNLYLRNLYLMAQRISESTLGRIKLDQLREGEQSMPTFLPSPTAIETALGLAHPKKEIRFIHFFGNVTISPEVLQEYRARGIYLIVLPWQDIDLEDTHQTVDPNYFMYHDYYHAADQLLLENNQMEISAPLLSALEKLPLQYRPSFFPRLVKWLVDLESLRFLEQDTLLLFFWDFFYIHFVTGKRDTEAEPLSDWQKRFKFRYDTEVDSSHRQLMYLYPLDTANEGELREYAQFIQHFLWAMGDNINNPLLTPLKERIEKDVEQIKQRFPTWEWSAVEVKITPAYRSPVIEEDTWFGFAAEWQKTRIISLPWQEKIGRANVDELVALGKIFVESDIIKSKTFFDDQFSEDDTRDEETYDPNKTGMDKINRLILPLLRPYPEAFGEISNFVIQNFNQLFVPFIDINLVTEFFKVHNLSASSERCRLLKLMIDPLLLGNRSYFRGVAKAFCQTLREHGALSDYDLIWKSKLPEILKTLTIHQDTTSVLLKEFIPLTSDDVLLQLASGVNQLARQSKAFAATDGVMLLASMAVKATNLELKRLLVRQAISLVDQSWMRTPPELLQVIGEVIPHLKIEEQEKILKELSTLLGSSISHGRWNEAEEGLVMRVGDLIARLPNSIEGIVPFFQALEKGWGRSPDLRGEGTYSSGNARTDFLGNYDRLALLVEHVVTFRHDFVPPLLTLLHQISCNPTLSPGGHHALGMAFSAILNGHSGLYRRTMAQLFRENTKTWFDTLVFLLRRNPTLIDLKEVLQVTEEEILDHLVLPLALLCPEKFTPAVCRLLTRLNFPYSRMAPVVLAIGLAPNLEPKTRQWVKVHHDVLERGGYYPLKNTFAQHFKTGRHSVLIVHNIEDGFGDELIRIGGLVSSLHDFNPELEITLVTDRKNSYQNQAFPNLRLLSHTEFLAAVRVGDYFAPPEMVFDFSRHGNHFNPQVTEGLKTVIDKYPPLFLAKAGVFSDTTHALDTRFGWSSVCLDGIEQVESLSLNQRGFSMYSPGIRLLLHLGMDPRAYLRGVPLPALSPEGSRVRQVWQELRQGQDRPVVLINPFGSMSTPHKGYLPDGIALVPSLGFDLLRKNITHLVNQGYFVVIAPSQGKQQGGSTHMEDSVIQEWGLRAQADEVINGLSPSVASHVASLPDGLRGSTLNLVVQSADWVVSVEGGMVHAASLLGKRVSVIMAPGSGDESWIPPSPNVHIVNSSGWGIPS